MSHNSLQSFNRSEEKFQPRCKVEGGEKSACRDTRVKFIQNKKPNMIFLSAKIACMRRAGLGRLQSDVSWMFYLVPEAPVSLCFSRRLDWTQRSISIERGTTNDKQLKFLGLEFIRLQTRQLLIGKVVIKFFDLKPSFLLLSFCNSRRDQMIIQTSDKTKTTNHRDEIFLLRGVPLYSLAPASGDQWDIISLLMQALLPQSNAYHGRIFWNTYIFSYEFIINYFEKMLNTAL